MTENSTPRLSPADQELLAQLSPDERDLVLSAMRALCLILALVALVPQARAQPLPPDQACSEIVKTLDRITGHRDSNQEAVRRGFIACQLFPTRSTPPPSGNVLDEIEPNPRGITRSEVEQAVAEWCQTHIDAPLCKKLEPPARP